MCKLDFPTSQWTLHFYCIPGSDFTPPGPPWWDDSILRTSDHQEQRQNFTTRPQRPKTGGGRKFFQHQLSSGTTQQGIFCGAPRWSSWGAFRWFQLWSGHLKGKLRGETQSLNKKEWRRVKLVPEKKGWISFQTLKSCVTSIYENVWCSRDIASWKSKEAPGRSLCSVRKIQQQWGVYQAVPFQKPRGFRVAIFVQGASQEKIKGPPAPPKKWFVLPCTTHRIHVW